MTMSLSFLLLAVLAVASTAPLSAETPAPKAPEPNAIDHVHDPHMAKDGAYYYVFATGPGLMIRRSKDLAHWTFVGRVFSQVPEWTKAYTRGSDFIWAPDVAYFKGRYLLYYAVSTFGSNHSAIGLATNETLDPDSKRYKWVDRGRVWETVRGDNYNAIDPGLVVVGKDRIALALGSFWSGLKLLPLNASTGLVPPDAKPTPIAQRPMPGAIEAPAILRHGRYYYQFVSFDYCCRGVNSTYNIRVGRAATVEGPYVDKDGKSMLEGGGTLLLGTQGRFIGPGHCSVLPDGKKVWLVYHFYDRDTNGTPTLQIRPLHWDAAGWPTVGPPVGSQSTD